MGVGEEKSRVLEEGKKPLVLLHKGVFVEDALVDGAVHLLVGGWVSREDGGGDGWFD